MPPGSDRKWEQGYAVMWCPLLVGVLGTCVWTFLVTPYHGDAAAHDEKACTTLCVTQEG